jgi:hypothetical protein
MVRWVQDPLQPQKTSINVMRTTITLRTPHLNTWVLLCSWFHNLMLARCFVKLVFFLLKIYKLFSEIQHIDFYSPQRPIPVEKRWWSGLPTFQNIKSGDFQKKKKPCYLAESIWIQISQKNWLCKAFFKWNWRVFQNKN